MPDEVKTAIEDNATGPKRASGDSSSIEQHDLEDQIKADRYLDQADASDKSHRGLRFTKLVPPGAGS